MWLPGIVQIQCWAETIRFNPVSLGCTHCIGKQWPLLEILKAERE